MQIARSLLVIDDDGVSRRTVARILEKAGYQVLQAEHGEAGLALFQAHRADLVLLDVVMPGMDGYEVCRQLRAMAGAALPILMLTGLNDIESVGHAFESGATDFISKPINWPLLAERVRYALRTRDMQVELVRQRQQLANAHRIAQLGYFEYDARQKTMHCSAELRAILGCPEAAASMFKLSELMDLIPAEDAPQMQEAFAAALRDGISYTLDHRLRQHGGEMRFVTHHGEAVRDAQGSISGVLAVVQDITDRREAEMLTHYRAYHDAVTGLPNRRAYVENAARLLEDQEQAEKLDAVIVLKIDRFAALRDRLGYALSNELLMQVGGRLEALLGGGGLVAYFDAAVFALLLRGFHHVDEISQQAAQIGSLLTPPFALDAHEIYLTVSMGVAIHPLESDEIEVLLKNAGVALSRALDEGGNVDRFFTAEMDRHVQNRHALEADLRHALERRQIEVFYQPQIAAATGQIHGMEALVRWRHPDRGMVSPLDFIPLAEETGLIGSIGEWVLETACRDCKGWLRLAPKLVVGVNLSIRQLRDGLEETVKSILQRTGLPAVHLDLEITESMAMQDFEVTLRLLDELRKEGISISLDDFGTGHSSLGYLRQLPMDTVKIDRAFVKDIGDSDNGVLARTIIAMSHGLGMHCIAEGVENPLQRQFLIGQGCDLLQGYLYSPPLPREKFEAYLRTHCQAVPLSA